MEQITFLNEKKTQLVHDNFKFQFDSKKRVDEAKFYRCVEYKATQCPATLCWKNDDLKVSIRRHNHAPMFPIQAEYLISVERLKQGIESGAVPSTEIKQQYEQIYTQLDQKHGQALVSPHWKPWGAVRSGFYKIASRVNGTEPKPVTTRQSRYTNSTAVKATETDTPGVKKFVPNFKKHPEFHYANKNIYSNAKPADDNAKDKSADTSVTSVEMNETNLAQALEFSLPAELSEAVVIEEKSMISIKIRAENERDFVELDIDRNMEFDDFKAVCMWELDNNNMDVPVLKIRKLPNVLIRNTRDVKRLVDDQEIEFIFK